MQTVSPLATQVINLDAESEYVRTKFDSETLKLLAKNLEERGWCFVKGDPKIGSLVHNLVKKMETLFASEEKVKYAAPHGFGYSQVDHKEGYRVLTGPRLRNFEQQGFIPPDLNKSLFDLSSAIDSQTCSLVYGICQEIFGRNPPNLARKADIPVAWQRHFGMLDIAHYFNKQLPSGGTPPMGTSIEDVNCVPHYDPGLLSISYFSNLEGLQLFDPQTNSWIDGPVASGTEEGEIWVMWLGEAAVKASKKPVKAGIHRVIYPSKPTPRVTLWYEVCTVKQATEPEDRYINSSQVQVPNIVDSKPISVGKDEKVVDILQKIERKRGIPRSKIARVDDFFKIWLKIVMKKKK